MKINADLRAAVRSAYNTQKQENAGAGARNRKAANAAVLALIKRKPSILKQYHAAKNKMADLQNEIGVQRKAIESLGFESSVGWDSDNRWRITSAASFVKTGGTYKEPVERKWTFDEVMALLAQAPTEKAAVAILAKYGINWK